MALSADEYANFERLVRDTNGRHELACRPYLKHAENALFQRTVERTVEYVEVRNYTGDCDLVTVVDVRNDQNHVERIAYVWELKAPQCYLFEHDDNKNRCRPTLDFIKAENQLLHYVNDLAKGTMRERWGIIKGSNIRPGGIIIGTSDRIVSNPKDASSTTAANWALKLRLQRLYKSENIRIVLWDFILDAVKPALVL